MTPATPSPADLLIAAMAGEIGDGDVVATGVASPLAILAIALARATHAPRLTYLACVGALDPEITRLHGSSEDLRYLDGRRGELTIAELFDHARRQRVDVMFFGAAEVDAEGSTNLSAAGSLAAPRPKFPGVAGAGTLRRWVRRPVLVVGKHSRRTLVERVQVVSTRDAARETRLYTNLAAFALGPGGTPPRLEALQSGVAPERVRAQTGFDYQVPAPPRALPVPSREALGLLARLDPEGLRHRQVSPEPSA